MSTISGLPATRVQSLSSQTKAVFFGTISATCLSFIPLTIRISDSSVDPFIFNAARMAAISMTLVAYLYISARSALGVRPGMREIAGIIAAPITDYRHTVGFTGASVFSGE